MRNRSRDRTGIFGMLARGILIGIMVTFTCVTYSMKAIAAESDIEPRPVQEAIDPVIEEEESDDMLHAFYPAFAVFDEQMKEYIDQVDSLSFAWSRIDSEDFESLNVTKGKNGNYSFYYPKDFLQPIEYAKSVGKPIQLSIYMDQSDCIPVLPYEEKRSAMINAIMESLTTDITQGSEIYYDGVVIDFEGLRNSNSSEVPLLYEGEPISIYFTQFLSELKEQLLPLSKKLYVAVNPGLYYDGYDYGAIIDIADRVILMAHDYEPTERLTKKQMQQYTGYNALEPISSMAPFPLIRQALNEMAAAVSDQEELSKVWLQITFDSAQWQFDVEDAAAWESLAETSLSRKGRSSPLYKLIKARVDNVDGNGQSLTYGYNNELQSPYLQYYNTADKSWNVILYEDSNSIAAKIELAKAYGLGGISIWSLANVPDYTDKNGNKYHLDGWTTILEQMGTYGEPMTDNEETVKIKDPVLEQDIRGKLGKPTGNITRYDLQSIYRLKLSKGVINLSELQYLTNLEYLDAEKLGIKDITPIGDLKTLKVLYLQRNAITDISGLKKLKNLEILSLNGNQLSTISALSGLTKLRELYLRENKLTSITSLSKLTKLEILEIGSNSIKDIAAVKNLKKLRQLSFDNNYITDISPLKELTSLEILYLQRNSISNISSLSGLKKLKLLSLNGNSISDLKPLAKLISLEYLYLKDNKITKVNYLKGLINLKELYLSGNQIIDFTPLATMYITNDFQCDFKL